MKNKRTLLSTYHRGHFYCLLTLGSLDCRLGLTHQRLSELLDKHQFDAFVESLCEKFCASSLGRPSLTPGIHFRSLLVDYFEGIDSERGVAWRLADSLSLRRFLAIELDEQAPDHSTISRTRRLIDIETCSPGRCGCWRAKAYWRAERSASTQRCWKPTRRCARWCVATRARTTNSI